MDYLMICSEYTVLLYTQHLFIRALFFVPPGDTSWVNDTTFLPLHHCYQSGTRTRWGRRVWRSSEVAGIYHCWDHHTEIWWAATSTCVTKPSGMPCIRNVIAIEWPSTFTTHCITKTHLLIYQPKYLEWSIEQIKEQETTTKSIENNLNK